MAYTGTSRNAQQGRANNHELWRELQEQLPQMRLGQADDKTLEKFVQKCNYLMQGGMKPQELHSNVQILEQLAQTSAEVAQRFQQAQGTKPEDIVNALLEQFGGDDGERPNIPWKRIARDTHKSFIEYVPGMSSLLGRMYVQPESKAPRKTTGNKPRQKREDGPVERTVQDGEIKESEKQELDKVMEEMWTLVQQHGPVQAGRLFMNHQSFAQTVENVFGLSFLVNNGHVVVQDDYPEGAIVSVRQRHPGDKKTRYSNKATQLALSIGMAEWEVHKLAIDPEECLMSHREHEFQYPEWSDSSDDDDV